MKSSWKETSFPAEMPLIKLIGAANFSVAHDCSEISAFVPQEHQIRMLSDKLMRWNMYFKSAKI